ncbi:hypothetical protein [Geomicrobium sp. JCM 19039]|nr:hypothetical protein [Geomicrobium sp. JCM 19039]
MSAIAYILGILLIIFGYLIGVKKKLHLLSFVWIGFSEDLVTSL